MPGRGRCARAAAGRPRRSGRDARPRAGALVHQGPAARPLEGRPLGTFRAAPAGAREPAYDAARGIEYLRKGIAIQEQLAADQPDNLDLRQELGAAYNLLGLALEDRGNIAGALEIHRNALAVRESLVTADPANRKFRRRFRYVEDRLRERGKKPADAQLDEMEKLWSDAKAREREGPNQGPAT